MQSHGGAAQGPGNRRSEPERFGGRARLPGGQEEGGGIPLIAGAAR